jgi:hypothetical protein
MENNIKNMKTRNSKDPRPGKVEGVTTGRGGTHSEIGGKSTKRGYKTTYLPKKGTPMPTSMTGSARKVKSSAKVVADRGGEKVIETGKRTDRKSLLNKNVEKTKIKSESGTKKIKTNLKSGRIDVKFKGNLVKDMKTKNKK